MGRVLLGFAAAAGFGPWVWIGIGLFTILSATNDIAIDGYTIELPGSQRARSCERCAHRAVPRRHARFRRSTDRIRLDNLAGCVRVRGGDPRRLRARCAACAKGAGARTRGADDPRVPSLPVSRLTPGLQRSSFCSRLACSRSSTRRRSGPASIPRFGRWRSEHPPRRSGVLAGGRTPVQRMRAQATRSEGRCSAH